MELFSLLVALMLWDQIKMKINIAKLYFIMLNFFDIQLSLWYVYLKLCINIYAIIFFSLTTCQENVF